MNFFKKLAKKGASVGDIWPLALILIVTTIGLAFGADIQNDIREDLGEGDCAGYWNTTSQQCEVSSTNSTLLSSNDVSYNITTSGMEATQTFGDKLDTVALVIVAAIIIGLLIREFM